jgi:hypothetical protein
MITSKLNLAALKHVKMEVNGKSGKVQGIFIPIEANKFFQWKDGAVYLDLVGFEMKEAKDYATHIVKQSFSKDVREKMGEEEMKALPILGNHNASTFSQKETVSDAGEGKVFEPTSDLPF